MKSKPIHYKKTWSNTTKCGVWGVYGNRTKRVLTTSKRDRVTCRRCLKTGRCWACKGSGEQGW